MTGLMFISAALYAAGRITRWIVLQADVDTLMAAMEAGDRTTDSPDSDASAC